MINFPKIFVFFFIYINCSSIKDMEMTNKDLIKFLSVKIVKKGFEYPLLIKPISYKRLRQLYSTTIIILKLVRDCKKSPQEKCTAFVNKDVINDIEELKESIRSKTSLVRRKEIELTDIQYTKDYFCYWVRVIDSLEYVNYKFMQM